MWRKLQERESISKGCDLVRRSVSLCRQALRVPGVHITHSAEEISSWLTMDQDVELSATSPVLCLPRCCHASQYDENEQNL